jgi:peptide/nickel transport system ATP-binding protein
MALLEVRDLTIRYRTTAGEIRAVDAASLQVDAGEAVGLAGESGCGKTTTALAIPGLLPDNGYVADGSIVLDGRELIGLSEAEMEKIRWREASVVFQGAMNALNPVKRVGEQIEEPIRLHEPETSAKEARARVDELLERVGIPAARGREYPHEFSGGMRQRVMIAMALACRPKLIIADEPVTALDVMVQAQILRLLKDLRDQLGLAMILISHDLSVIAETCDRAVIMYAGRTAESGDVRSIFRTPAHPYTQALIRAFPNVRRERAFVAGIPGYPPDLRAPIEGCAFADRCSVAIDRCRTEMPTLRPVSAEHAAACHLVAEVVS